MKKFLKPTGAGPVVHPVTHDILPVEGKEVVMDRAWTRLLSAGDVEESRRPSRSVAKASEKSEEK